MRRLALILAFATAAVAASAGTAATRDSVTGSLIQEDDPTQTIDFRSHLTIAAHGTADDADGHVRFEITSSAFGETFFRGDVDCVIAIADTAVVGGVVTDASPHLRRPDGSLVWNRFLIEAFDDDERAGGNDLAFVKLGNLPQPPFTPQVCGTLPVAHVLTGFVTRGNLVIRDAELEVIQDAELE